MQEDPILPLSRFERVKGAPPGRKPSNARRPAPPVPLDEVFFGNPSTNPSLLSAEDEMDDSDRDKIYLNDPEEGYAEAISEQQLNKGGGAPVGGRKVLPPPPCWTPVLPNKELYYDDAESLSRNSRGVTVRPTSGYSEFADGRGEKFYSEAESVPVQFNENDAELYEYIPEDHHGLREYYNDNSDEFDGNNDSVQGYYTDAVSPAVKTNWQQTEVNLPRINLRPAIPLPSQNQNHIPTGARPVPTKTQIPTDDKRPLGQHLGTRVIVNGLNTARLKEKRSGLRPRLSIPPASASISTEPEIDPQQFAELTLSEKRKLFEARLSTGSQGALSPSPQPLGRRNLGSSSGQAGTQWQSATGFSNQSCNQADTRSQISSGNTIQYSGNSTNQNVYPGRASTSSISGQGSHSRGGSMTEEVGTIAAGVKNIGFRSMPPPAALSNEKRQVEVENQVPLSSCSWYWNKSGRQACEKALRTINTEGAFLVRDSHKSDPAKPYSISILHERDIYTLAIRLKSNQKYALASEKEDEKEFASVAEMISYHQKYPILVVRRGGVSGSGQVLLVVCF